MKTKEEIAAEAYQVIGTIACYANIMDQPEVIRALNYFSKHADSNDIDEDILPWGIYKECEPEVISTSDSGEQS